MAGQGAAWLKAWQTRHGGGCGSAWGPVVVNEQIARMTAAVGRAKSLSGAGGLSAGQHRFWAAAAADETKRLGVLRKELTTERAWRYQLGLNELGAGQGDPRGREPASRWPGRSKGWKAQLGRDRATVAAISKMLGYSDAYLAAHKPAPCRRAGDSLLRGRYRQLDRPGAGGGARPVHRRRARAGWSLDRGGDAGTRLEPGVERDGQARNPWCPAGGGKLEVTLHFDPSFARATGLTPQQVANIRATVHHPRRQRPGRVRAQVAAVDPAGVNDTKLAFALVLASRGGDQELASAICARFTSPNGAVAGLDRACRFLAIVIDESSDVTGIRAEEIMREFVEEMAALP